MKVRTRFAPSPTGDLHVGNARTALFNALYAAGHAGQFLVRIEDTDAQRSSAAKESQQLNDLHWLGLSWQEGPDSGGPRGPYRQSERSDIYLAHIHKLTDQGLTYPCFCTPAELALARKTQLAAGKPPRYAGTCAHLSVAEVKARTAKGLKPALRFRVPDEGATEFTDLVRGPQHFAHRDIGDFVIQRADGSPAFFFSNALDDALMGITHVLRGEDHLANTPRQLLLLEALGLSSPQYGHLSMVVGTDGQPLSKRRGSVSLGNLREQAYMPLAVLNYMARLGHAYMDADNTLMSFRELAEKFDVARISHSPAHLDENHLHHWQKIAIANTSDEKLWDWMKTGTGVDSGEESVEGLVPKDKRLLFVRTVRPNILLSADIKSGYQPHYDAWFWAHTFFSDGDFMMTDGEKTIRESGADYFRKAQLALDKHADYSAFAKDLAATTGLRGAGLYMPLRAALTGDTHGPELKLIWELLGQDRIRQRLEKAAMLAKG